MVPARTAALLLLACATVARAEEPAALPGPPTLVGVVQVPAPGRSVIVLRSGERSRVVAVGETAFGARVLRTTADAATVDLGGSEVELKLGAAAPASVRPATPALAAAPPTAVQPSTGDAREWSRDDLQRRLSQEAPRIMAETTLMPVWNAGRVAGFTITRVPEGSVLADAGLQAGDVLTHVNGTPIDSLATLVGLWPRLQAAPDVDADLLRGGQPVHLQISLK